MYKCLIFLLLPWVLAATDEIECFDIGDVSGNYMYEEHQGNKKIIYQCEKSISNCNELLQGECKQLSKELLEYLHFVEIKDGFLTTQSCLDNGLFYDCPLMEYQDNTLPLILVDRKGNVYKLDLELIKASVIDKLILKQSITVQGHYSSDNDLIKVNKIFEQVLKNNKYYGIKVPKGLVVRPQ